MENPAILLRRLNPYCARAMEGAASLCQTRAHAEILPEHWLLKLLEQGEGDLTVLARRYEWDMDALWQDLLGWLDNQPRSVRSRPQLSADIQILIQEAWLIASLNGEEHIRSVHLLMVLVGKPKLAAATVCGLCLRSARASLIVFAGFWTHSLMSVQMYSKKQNWHKITVVKWNLSDVRSAQR